ncbi:hypothetical protein F7725_001879 [Dissostichus mawsoni]|uniref:ERCC1-like central domain-containing protein n=1 Tax=Dissostichus mawsoni TaxID=36200 RepID=A0A7J5Y115_DISMA|nr:hypothetical protein F7725_001879 [Dissostichus mawsoni]
MKKRFNINLDDSAFTKERTPPKPQFQASSKGGQNTSASNSCSTNPANEPVDQPISYADYVVQSKSSVAGPPQRVGPSKLLRTEGDGDSNLKQSDSDSVRSAPGLCETVQDPAKGTEDGSDGAKNSEKTHVDDGTHQEEGNCQRSYPSLNLGPKPVGSGSSIIVSPRQRGNPILKFVRSVPWEFGEAVPDYILGQTTCALFLSLRYHNLNPNYIHDRLKLLGQTFTLRVLLVQVDVEAGRYLETYKSYEKKPADLLKEQVEKNYLSQVTDCLTTVKSINKTDAITLLSTFSVSTTSVNISPHIAATLQSAYPQADFMDYSEFILSFWDDVFCDFYQSVEGIISASKEDLVLCPGLGPQKARRLYDVLHKPFLKSKTKDS